MSDDNDIKVAILGEQISGIREQQKAHANATEVRFNSLDDKIDDLTAIMNRGKGAYAASIAFSGVIGAAIVAVLSAIGNFFHK